MPVFDNHGIKGGVWSGRLRDMPPPARVCVTCMGEVIAEAALADDADGGHQVRVDLPGSLISDGIVTLVLVADQGGPGDPVGADAIHLHHQSLVTGKPLDQDLVAELSALRAEMELLKREFRRFAFEAQG
ncbi:hypothetical protein MU516_01820 [Paracoccus sp. YLB-12]|uniref:Uncharacterized protein n=1 Tax=Paracoccus maritimus TaxID=2933292 RepID=A0ABT2K4Y7_9RHOB|nr:hypothetical protein [Paracoccus sp. YLB-12]MCT4331602.1 hypothetical protein [Paracoccus sp. YLB-12]